MTLAARVLAIAALMVGAATVTGIGPAALGFRPDALAGGAMRTA